MTEQSTREQIADGLCLFDPQTSGSVAEVVAVKTPTFETSSEH